MHFKIAIKFWFFHHFWWILLIAIVMTIGYLVCSEDPVVYGFPILGVLLSSTYFLQKQKLEETKLFREIFKECNARYEAINDQLELIASKNFEDLSHEDRSIIIDYLNLCGEEFLYYKCGYLKPVVWKAWKNGMLIYLKKDTIRKVWEAEKLTDSYYGLEL